MAERSLQGRIHGVFWKAQPRGVRAVNKSQAYKDVFTACFGKPIRLLSGSQSTFWKAKPHDVRSGENNPGQQD